MRSLLTLATIMLFYIATVAQTPQAVNYQAVVRDTDGNIMSNNLTSVRLSIRTIGGTIVYQETQSVTTNNYGLFNLKIGEGNATQGTFSTIDWGADTYELLVELDVAGGTNYTAVGSQVLSSVPYALHARTAETVPGVDMSNTNEIQTLSLNDDTLSLSGANSVVLPSGVRDIRHAGYDLSGTSLIYNSTTYQMWDDGIYGNADAVDIEAGDKVYVRVSALAYKNDGSNSYETVYLYLCPCYSNYASFTNPTIPSYNGQTSAKFHSTGSSDMHQVSADYIFTGIAPGSYNFSFCAKRGSSSSIYTNFQLTAPKVEVMIFR